MQKVILKLYAQAQIIGQGLQEENGQDLVNTLSSLRWFGRGIEF